LDEVRAINSAQCCATAQHVDFEVFCAKHSRLTLAHLGTAQQSPEPGQEFLRGEWEDEYVVCTALERAQSASHIRSRVSLQLQRCLDASI
jgi:hypothetical protein